MNVSKRYDHLQALDNVNIGVLSGRIVSIVGVNGAGKTTLLKILAGLDTMNEGKILVDGREASQEELRACSTMVFQKSIMFSGSVYDNVAYGLRVQHVQSGKLRERVLSALRIVNLENFEKRKANKLSSGEQQRVAIARALVIERDVLLIDEPTANLDPTNATIIEQGIKEAANSRILLLSTHNLSQARRLSERIVHLHKGCIIEENDTSSFFANPRDERTKFFLDGELNF
ncbi:MAG TPA: ATP-binding cassette domain-containing protein [Candidatus Acidoferrales bacterium]|nr:ATP-binding cassette domain-containing protein [Candidatus Acidoferrales bacterium]